MTSQRVEYEELESHIPSEKKVGEIMILHRICGNCAPHATTLLPPAGDVDDEPDDDDAP